MTSQSVNGWSFPFPHSLPLAFLLLSSLFTCIFDGILFSSEASDLRIALPKSVYYDTRRSISFVYFPLRLFVCVFVLPLPLDLVSVTSLHCSQGRCLHAVSLGWTQGPLQQ